MIKLELIKMGMDFYENESGDFGNHRLRIAYAGANGTSDLYIKLPNGHYICGDFCFWRKNKTNNKDHDSMYWDFTEYDENMQNSTRFKGFDCFNDVRMLPKRDLIAVMMSKILNDDVIIAKN